MTTPDNSTVVAPHDMHAPWCKQGGRTGSTLGAALATLQRKKDGVYVYRLYRQAVCGQYHVESACDDPPATHAV
jgi:hypothetical protein